MPVEFSVAAYRLGHSMIRPGYRLNDDDILLPIFPDPSEANPGFPEGLTGFRAMNPDWGIDWGRFIDIDTRAYDGDDADRQQEAAAVRLPHRHLAGRIRSQAAAGGCRRIRRRWRCAISSAAGGSACRRARASPKPWG